MREKMRARRDIAWLWLVRTLMVTSALAMLATSSDYVPDYSFQQTFAQSSFQLTSAEPSVTIEIVATATGLSPAFTPTTDDASVGVNGTLLSENATGALDGGSGNDADPGAPHWVSVWIEEEAADAHISAQSVLTQFSASHALHFTGNCRAPAGAFSPCQAVQRLHFDREDGGQNGGVVTVSWSLRAFASAEGNDGTTVAALPVPWTVEVRPQ